MSAISDCTTLEDCMGFLTINSVGMHNGAWFVLDCIPLWIPQVLPRGDNLVVPNMAGTYPRRLRRDEQHYSLPMLIAGDVDENDTPNANPFLGLQTNLQGLQTNVVETSFEAPVAATLDMPDGQTWTADVQVKGIIIGKHVDWLLAKATLEITIPFGKFIGP